jgi:hypothetical protein
MAAFPLHTIEWKAQEQTAWRRFTLSLPWFGVASGVALHAYRWGALSTLVPRELSVVLAEVAIGVALLCALTAGHLANYTLRSWRWRAPALGAFIALGESATALVLTMLHLERLGRAEATLADWPASVLTILLTRVVVVSLFALILSVVVAALRKTVERSEERVAGTD